MTDTHNTSTLVSLGATLCILTIGLAGCADQPTAVDRTFGQSIRNAQVGQSIHPHDIPPAYPPLVSDAVSGKAAIERYYKSYETPPPAGNVFNIGVGAPMIAPTTR